jgi:RHS repeat-associated protein
LRQAAGGQGALYYPLADQLGSTSTLTDASGTVVATEKCWPYGAARAGGITQTDKLFTGQQIEPGDSALGLYNYNARFYSTTLGRFVSVDPIVGSAADPQAWNSYAYVRNNPMRFVDPTAMYLPDDPSGPDFHPAPGEDRSGHSFVHDSTCDDLCGALVYLAAVRDNPLRMLAAVGLTSPQMVQQAAAAAWASTVAQGAGPGSSAPPHSGSLLSNLASGTMGGLQTAVGVGIACAQNDVCRRIAAAASSPEVAVASMALSVAFIPDAQANERFNSDTLLTPATGKPGSTQVFPKPGGGKQIRIYGPDGKAVKDIDYGHNHGAGDPHVHVWDWGKKIPRQEGRSPAPGEVP